MTHDKYDYLTALALAGGRMGLRQLQYEVTHTLSEELSVTVLADVQQLRDAGLLRIEYHHSAAHKRIERTACLSRDGREACTKEIAAAHRAHLASGGE